MKLFFTILLLFFTLCSFGQTGASNTTKVYEQPEKPAYFGAGKDSLDRFVKQNMHMRHGGTSGVANAIVVFIVEKDGHIGAAEILRTSGDKDLDAEAVSIVKSMPKWEPDKNKGVAVRSSTMLTFSYTVK